MKQSVTGTCTCTLTYLEKISGFSCAWTSLKGIKLPKLLFTNIHWTKAVENY